MKIVRIVVFAVMTVVGFSPGASAQTSPAIIHFEPAVQIPSAVVNKKLVVRLESHCIQGWEFQNAEWNMIFSFPVAIGMNSSPTPLGYFLIYDRVARANNYDASNAITSELGSALSYAYLIYPSGSKMLGVTLAIHGWDWHPGARKWGWGRKHVGHIAVTGGCVQLLRKHMRKVYKWTELGTPLSILQ